jgi:hypothetical protein
VNLFAATAWLLLIASCVLGLALVGVSAVLLADLGAPSSEVVRRRREDLLHLCLVLVLVLASLRLMSWPILLGFLESMVEQVHGAMCAFGVARLHPGLIESLHWKKTLVLAGLGGWVAVFSGLRLMRDGRVHLVKLLVLLGTGMVLFGLEASDEISWLLYSWSGGTRVSCCTTVIDLASSAAPGSAGAGHPGGPSVLGPLVVLLAASLAVGRILGRNGGPPGKTTFWLLSTAHLAVAVPLVPLGLRVLTSDIGPFVMGLPHHRCLYELVCRTPDFALILALASLAPATAVWACLVALARLPSGRGEIPSRLAAVGTLSLAGASLMVAIHLLVHWASVR